MDLAGSLPSCLYVGGVSLPPSLVVWAASSAARGRGRREGTVSLAALFRFRRAALGQLAQGAWLCSELSRTSGRGRLWSNHRALAASVAFSW